jgi:hypothetical protein
LNSEDRKSGRPARAREGSPLSLARRGKEPDQNPKKADTSEFASPPDVDPVDELVTDYGDWQRKHDLPQLEVGQGLRAQIATANIDPQEFRAVLDRAARSDWLTGRVAGTLHGQASC